MIFWTKIKKKQNVIFFISNERKRRIKEGFVFLKPDNFFLQHVQKHQFGCFCLSWFGLMFWFVFVSLMLAADWLRSTIFKKWREKEVSIIDVDISTFLLNFYTSDSAELWDTSFAFSSPVPFSSDFLSEAPLLLGEFSWKIIKWIIIFKNHSLNKDISQIW